MGPFQVATGHSIQKQAGRCRLWSLRKEPLLYPCLGPSQPIEVFVQRIRIKGVSAKDITGSMRQRQPHGREPRALIDHAGDHLPQRQLPCTGCAQGLVYPQASGDWGDRPHRTKRRPWRQRDRVLDGPQVLQVCLVSQGKPERFDLGLGTMTHMRNGAMEYFAVGAIRLAQQMPRLRFATTGDVRGIDIHSGYYNSIFIALKQG